VKEFTLTGEYKMRDWLVSRLEFRDDWSDEFLRYRKQSSARKESTPARVGHDGLFWAQKVNISAEDRLSQTSNSIFANLGHHVNQRIDDLGDVILHGRAQYDRSLVWFQLEISLEPADKLGSGDLERIRK
jgi:hypothetical protein